MYLHAVLAYSAMALFKRTSRVAIVMLIAYQLIFEGSKLNAAAEGCDNGFIRLDMLKTLAQKIPTGSASTNRLSSESRLIPDWNFTCNGTITSFLVGADIRTVNLAGTRTLYPQVQIWRRTNASSPVREYARVWSEEIRLEAGYFSPNGVLEYNLKDPFSFQAGDIFGIYQPIHSNSLVRVYYNAGDNTAPVAHTLTGLSIENITYNIESGEFLLIQQELILISPVTGKFD